MEKKEIGVVWDEFKKTERKIKLKHVEKKILNQSLSKKLIKFINWFSIYNIVPKGMVLKMCLGNLRDFEELKKEEKYKIKTNTTKYFLNVEQKNAVKYLTNVGEKFNVSVLIGITGSGKTLVYFERIKKLIKQNKQALILIPEIFLTTQFKKRLNSFLVMSQQFGIPKLVKIKKNIWNLVAQNKIKIVIGARSSLFLPFKNLGLIVVDEEHDSLHINKKKALYITPEIWQFLELL